MQTWKMGGTLALSSLVLFGSPVHAQPRRLLPRLSQKDVKHRAVVERASKRAVQAEIGVDVVPPALGPAPLLVADEVAPQHVPSAPLHTRSTDGDTDGEDAEASPEPEPGAAEEYVMSPEMEPEDQRDAAAAEPDAAPDADAAGVDAQEEDVAPAPGSPTETGGDPGDAAESGGDPAASDEETIHIVVLDGSGFTQVRDIQSPTSGQRRQIVRDDQGRLIEIVRDRDGNLLSAQDVGADELPR